MITAQEARELHPNKEAVIKEKLSLIEKMIRLDANSNVFYTDIVISDDSIKNDIVNILKDNGFKITICNNILTIDWSK